MIWRRALVVAVPKSSKPVEDPRSYRPISLLCVPYKILERRVYARVEPLVDPLLPREQAGFRRGRFSSDVSTPASNLLLTLCSHGNRRVFDAEDWVWVCRGQPGSSSTVCVLVLDVSVRPCTNGVSLL